MITVDAAVETEVSGEAPTLRGRRLWTRWTAVVTAGESLGFVAPAVIGASSTEWSPLAATTLLVIAGGIEGTVLGWSQSLVLDRVFPALRGEQWMILTAAGAAAAYLLAAGLALVAPLDPFLAVAGVALFAPLILLSLGGLQWFELRHHVQSARHWIVWSAGAWLAALGAFVLIATPLWHAGQSAGEAVAVGVLAGAVMAGIQAAVTGFGLVRLVERASDDG